jgi:hypothetical protein
MPPKVFGRKWSFIESVPQRRKIFPAGTERLPISARPGTAETLAPVALADQRGEAGQVALLGFVKMVTVVVVIVFVFVVVSSGSGRYPGFFDQLTADFAGLKSGVNFAKIFSPPKMAEKSWQF